MMRTAYDTAEQAAEKSEKQIPRGLKPTRDDKKGKNLVAQLKVRLFKTPAEADFFSNL
jgi:hypothetical protein